MELYHYTSIDTLEKILSSKMFRFTNMKDLNDTTEYLYGVNLLKESVRTYELKSGIKAKINPAMFDIFLFDGLLFTVSFTNRKDDLFYWNSYYIEPNNSVSICVEKDEIFDENIALDSCIYGNPYPSMNDTSYRFFKGLFDNPLLISRNLDFIKITYQTALIKDYKFREEREWRGILFPNENDIRTFYRRGKQCKCVDYPLNIKGIKSLIVGPSNRQSENITKVHSLVEGLGLNIKVEHSEIPLLL